MVAAAAGGGQRMVLERFLGVWRGGDWRKLTERLQKCCTRKLKGFINVPTRKMGRGCSIILFFLSLDDLFFPLTWTEQPLSIRSLFCISGIIPLLSWLERPVYDCHLLLWLGQLYHFQFVSCQHKYFEDYCHLLLEFTFDALNFKVLPILYWRNFCIDSVKIFN